MLKNAYATLTSLIIIIIIFITADGIFLFRIQSGGSSLLPTYVGVYSNGHLGSDERVAVATAHTIN